MDASKPSAEVKPLLDDLFRRESARLVSTLTRAFGSGHLELAEDVVQDALLKAMREWPYHGIPDNPSAWLFRAAKNAAIDRLRRDARGAQLLKENAALFRSEWTMSAAVGEALDKPAIADDQLRMMFACCHPSLPQEQQVALALRTLCGFSVPEIARAFVTNEETINKRLYRAREGFRAIGRLEIPAGDALNDRLDRVLSTIYLLFNEGYNSTHHDDLIREDLIEEALRLCDLLTQDPVTDRPEVHALLALMLFHAARSEVRLDSNGAIVLLPDQDRSKWDQGLISLAGAHLDRASSGERVTVYHAEAGIAALHANAPSFEGTDWPEVLRLYDHLLALNPSPIVAFNRAIALAQVNGPQVALNELDGVAGLSDNHLYHAARGDLLLKMGRPEDARAAYLSALDLARNPAETALIGSKLRSTVRS